MLRWWVKRRCVIFIPILLKEATPMSHTESRLPCTELLQRVLTCELSESMGKSQFWTSPHTIVRLCYVPVHLPLFLAQYCTIQHIHNTNVREWVMLCLMSSTTSTASSNYHCSIFVTQQSTQYSEHTLVHSVSVRCIKSYRTTSGVQYSWHNRVHSIQSTR